MENKYNSGQNQRRRRRNGGKRKQQYKKGNRPNTSTKVMGVQPVLGAYKTTVLKYVDPSDQRYAAVSNYLVWAMKLNDLYDPDPLLATGGITGFSEMAAFYREYIVERVQIKCSFANQESFPIHVAVLATPTSLVSTVTSRSLALDAMERWGVLFRGEIGHNTGQDTLKMTVVVKPQDVFGDKIYRTDGSFSGSYVSSPTSTVYVNFIIVAPTSSNLVNGVFYDGEFSYRCRWYNIRNTLLGTTEEEIRYYMMMFSKAYKTKSPEAELYRLKIIELVEGQKSDRPLLKCN